MSAKRLGKRERVAKKRRISIRHRTVTFGCCSVCSTPVTWKCGRTKEKSFFTKLVCGQCRKTAKRALEYRG